MKAVRFDRSMGKRAVGEPCSEILTEQIEVWNPPKACGRNVCVERWPKFIFVSWEIRNNLGTDLCRCLGSFVLKPARGWVGFG